jgi:mRNA interferase MazF
MAFRKKTDTPRPTGAAGPAGKSGRQAYVPDIGDLVWLDFDPQAGHEQRGRRPALILTPSRYNALSGLCQACPITSRIKGYPFETLLPLGGAISGAILCDQLRSLDWRERRAEFAGQVPASVLAEVRDKLGALLGL